MGEMTPRYGKSRIKAWIMVGSIASVILVPLGMYWMFLTCDPLGVGFTCLAEYPFGTFIGGSTHEYTSFEINEFRDDFPVFAVLKGREVHFNRLGEEELLELFPELKDSSHLYDIDDVSLSFKEGRLTTVHFYRTKFKIGNEVYRLPLSSSEMRKRFGPPTKTDWYRNNVRWS